MPKRDRRIHPLTLTALAASLVLCIGGATAKNAPLQITATPAPTLATNTTVQAEGRFRADGSAIVLYRPDFAATDLGKQAGDKEAAAIAVARAFLDARHGKLGLRRADIDTLQTSGTRRIGALTTVRFQQNVGGLPVYRSDIAITVHEDGRVVFVDNHPVSAAAAITAGSFTAEQASRVVSRQYGQTLADKPPRHMLYVDDKQQTHGVWRVLTGHEEVLVDDRNGEIVHRRDMRLNASAKAKVYRPDPLSPGKHRYGDPGFIDNNNAASPELNDAMESVTLEDIKRVDGIYSLDGPYAACVQLEAPLDDACPARKTPTFEYKRNHKYFDAVNAYYHIDTFMRYVNETLGVEVGPGMHYDGGVQFDPHAVGGADNSYYNSATGKLYFGQGGVDDAQDASVVVHELGHGMHDWLTAGNLSQKEGLSEGFGDYLAGAYKIDHEHWGFGDPEFFWLFLWDGHNEFWPGRVTNWHLSHRYPDIGSGIHEQSQYFSSCNLKARDVLWPEDMDIAVLNGIAMTGLNSNQKDAAQAIITAARELGLPESDIRLLARVYNEDCSYGVSL